MVADFNKKINKEKASETVFFQIAGVIFLIFVLVLLIADFRMYQRKRQLAKEILAYKEKIENIKKSSEKLQEEIANSQNQDYLEKIAYDQGLARPGEKEFIFVKTAQDAGPAAVLKQNFLEKFWDWIKSIF